MTSQLAEPRTRVVAALACLLAGLGSACAEPVGDLGAADRLVVRGLATISAESLRAGLLADADLYWQGIPSADRDAYLAALQVRSRLALEADGFVEPQVAVAIEAGADGKDTIVIDVVEGPRYLAGPIRVTGVPDDMAARLVRFMQEKQPPRAASVRRSFGRSLNEAAFLEQKPSPRDFHLETIRLPDGTTTQQWLRDDGSLAKLHEPDWKPGEPAPFGHMCQESLCWSVREFFVREGYFDLTGFEDDPAADDFLGVLRKRVDVEVRPEGEQAVLVIHVKRLPPRSTLKAIEIAAGQKTTRKDLQAYLGLEIGQPVTEADRDLWLEKLRQSGRFVFPAITFAPWTDGVLARFAVDEYRNSPPLSAPLSPEQQALLRARELLLGEWHAGRQVKLEVTCDFGTDGEDPPDILEIVLDREAGGVVAITVGEARCGVAFVHDTCGLFMPNARLEGTPPGGHRPYPSMHLGVKADSGDADATEDNCFLCLGSGFGTRCESRVRIDPAWCVAFGQNAQSRREGDVLVVEWIAPDHESEPTIIRLDATTGRLLGMEQRSSGSRIEFRVETGDDLMTKALADLRAGSGENLADPSRPLVSAARFLAAACDSDAARAYCIDTFLDPEHQDALDDACGKVRDRIRRLLDAGSLAPLDAVAAGFLDDLSRPDVAEPLSMPNEPHRVDAMARPGTLGRWFAPATLRRLERSVGRDSAWAVVARAAVLVATSDASAAGLELDRLTPTPDTDPWAAVAADLLAALGRKALKDKAPAGLTEATITRLDSVADAVDEVIGRDNSIALAVRSSVAMLEKAAGSPAAVQAHSRRMSATADPVDGRGETQRLGGLQAPGADRQRR